MMENPEQVSILLVDDRKDKLLALRTVLSDLNQNLVEVTSGEDALRALLKQDFAAIVLDVHMPGMDGFETASLIRQRKRSEHTPIIFVTGININETHVTRGYSIGAVDYIFTPVDPTILRSKISVFIDLYRKTLQIKRQEELLRIQAEQRATSLEVRLESLLNRLNVGVFQSTKDGVCIECNPALRRILGEPLSRPAHEISLKWLGDAEVDYVGERFIHVKQSSGSAVWLSTTTREGMLNGMTIIEGMVEDVTQAKEAEDALRQSQANYHNLIQAMPQLVWTAEPNGKWDFASDQWCSYTGFESSQKVEQRWLELIHEDERVATQSAWNEALASENAYDVEHRLRSHLGHYRWFKTRAVPLKGEDSKVIRWFGTSTDIEDRKQAESKLTDSARVKDEFLAMLSHELRNPLSAISSAVQIAQKKGSPETLEWSCDIIQRQVKQLVRLIDDLLDVSRITRGKIELRKEVLNVNTIVESAKIASQSIMVERKHKLEIISSGSDYAVSADPARLEQILVNLLVNAAKYTPKQGNILLEIHSEDDKIFFEVKDNGIGISQEMLGKVFELFKQAEVSLARSKGGLGIGLTLAKKLAELHDGTLTASSGGVGKGSQFSLCLPLAEKSLIPRVLDRPGLKLPLNMKVLLVDDHVDTLDSTKVLLEQLGCEVKTCSEGTGVVAAAKKFTPDLIILDIGLPIMSGYEVAKALRDHRCFDETILAALSGYGQDKDKEASRQHGFDFHFVKPLDTRLLVSAVLAKGRLNMANDPSDI